MTATDKEKPQACRTCSLTKNTKMACDGTPTRGTAVFTVHVDVCSLLPNKLFRGYKYCIVMNAVPERYALVRLINNSVEVHSYYQKFIAWAEKYSEQKGLHLHNAEKHSGSGKS